MKFRKKPVVVECESCGKVLFLTPYRHKIGRGRFCSKECITHDWGTSHGLSQARIYKIWIGIKARCYNKKIKAYKGYGAKGISLHSKWHDFGEFLKDLGHPPTDKHQIDRIDNSKGYEPGNCKWSTTTQQARNTSRCKLNMGKAREIRKLKASGVSNAEISGKYRISLHNVWNVVSNRTWKDNGIFEATYERVEE